MRIGCWIGDDRLKKVSYLKSNISNLTHNERN